MNSFNLPEAQDGTILYSDKKVIVWVTECSLSSNHPPKGKFLIQSQSLRKKEKFKFWMNCRTSSDNLLIEIDHCFPTNMFSGVMDGWILVDFTASKKITLDIPCSLKTKSQEERTSRKAKKVLRAAKKKECFDG